MATSTVHVLHGVDTPSNFYSVVEDVDPRTNPNDISIIPAGHTQPMWVGQHGVNPAITFTAKEVGTALTEFTYDGVDLSGGNTDLTYRAATDLGVRVAKATTSHVRLRCAAAYGVVENITARHGEDATVRVRLLLAYDGTNNPIVPSGSVAYASDPAVAELWTLGPVDLNGSDLDGVEEMSIDFNPTYYEIASDGEQYPTFVGLQSVAPEVRLTTYTSGWATYGLNGTALSSTGFVAFLRSKTADADNVANGTLAHYKINGANGRIIVETTAANGSEPGRTTLRIPMRSTGTGDALTFTASQAIT